MAQVTGKLMWGQAGSYDAIDDRQVITAALLAPGMLIPPTMTAGIGLDIAVGPFTAVIFVGDGTVAVGSSFDELVVSEDAGGVALRRDILWLSGDPEGGTWELDIVSDQDIEGRVGLALGVIHVPPGANLATQFDMWPTQNNFNFARTFENSEERARFLDQMQHAWGSGYGQLTTLTNDVRGLGHFCHTDIANVRAHRWELLWNQDSPGYVQSGRGTYTSNASGYFTITYPMAFTQLPGDPYASLPAVTVAPGPGAAPIMRVSNEWHHAVQIQAQNLAGQPWANAAHTIYWMARGLIATDTWDPAGPWG